MEDLKKQCTSLEKELAALEDEHDQQKRLMTKTLKMFVDTLDSECPGGVKVKTAPKSTAELNKTVASLESTYRSYTMDRERLAAQLRDSLQRWIGQVKTFTEMKGAEAQALDALEGQLAAACDSYAGLSAFLIPLLDIQRATLLGEHEPSVGHSQLLPVEALITLKRLLGLLPLDDKGRKKAASISDTYQDEMMTEELSSRLNEIVALLEERNDDTVGEVTDFLKSLAEKLSDLQKALQDSRDESVELESTEDAHTEQISKGFGFIQEGLSKSTTLAELKLVVADQLESLVETFDDFKESRQQRIKILEQRYDKLVKHVSAVESDASAIRDTVQEARQRALTDHLTGLPNRRAYEDQLKSELHRWVRYKTPFSVLIADIDSFKKINDSLGHLIGDRALKLVAKVLRRQVRESDMIARYGGEEFVALIANSDVEAATHTAEKLRRAVEEARFKSSGNLVDIRISVGVTQVKNMDTVDSLFERADKALYRAKKAGRNRVEVG